MLSCEQDHGEGASSQSLSGYIKISLSLRWGVILCGQGQGDLCGKSVKDR